MKLTFDSNLQYQQDAIKSITDLFEGQPLEDSIMEFNLKEEGTLELNKWREQQLNSIRRANPKKFASYSRAKRD